MNSLEKRVIALEEKYLHQDRLVTELNSIVAQQTQTIDELINHIQRLQGDGSSSPSTLSLANLKDEVPPHY